jgi:putative acetyltransferase
VSLSVRAEEPGDRAAVHDVLVLAFGREAEANLVERLRGHPDTRVLVADADGEIAGCVVFSLVTAATGGADLTLAGLGPMAIAPVWQGQGAGTLLLQKGLEACERRGVDAVVVLGHPDYYRRFGFGPAHRHRLSCRWVVPEDAFMVKELRPGALARLRGRVEYLPEFDEV